MHRLLLIVIHLCIVLSKRETIEQTLARIQHYELIYINTDQLESDNIIEFDAFGEHYIISLVESRSIIDSGCHWNGEVINQPSTKTLAALSTCDTFGIRGSIIIGSDKLMIRPSSFYLDREYDRNNDHHLHDEHLIYKVSDFDSTGLKQPGRNHRNKEIPSIPNSNNIINKIENKLKYGPGHNNRKLLAANDGVNQVELLIICDPTFVRYYQNTYGSASTSWYPQLLNAVQTLVSDIAVEYQNNNWGSKIGGSSNAIQIKLAEVEVIVDEYYGSTYGALRPLSESWGDGCSDIHSSECVIDSNAWLSTFGDWINTNKDVTTFDNAQIWSMLDFGDAAGWGWIKTICKGRLSSANCELGMTGSPWDVKITAHEMGHNWGMDHDAQGYNECGENDGIMGYGSATSGWSSCSYDYLNDYFSNNDWLTCLGNGHPSSVRSNFGSDTPDDTPITTDPPTDAPSPAPTPLPTPSPNDSPSPAPSPPPTPLPTPNDSPSPAPTDPPTPAPVTSPGNSGCKVITDFAMGSGSINFNGNWQEGGTWNNQIYYIKSHANVPYYLYSTADYYDWWFISNTLGSGSCFAYCASTTLDDCSRNFNIYDGNTGFVGDADGTISNCAPTNTPAPESTPSPTVDTACSFEECIGITGMTINTELNDEWVPSGTCHNNIGYYTLGSRYLYWSDDYSLWLINSEVDDKYAQAYCGQEDVLQCGGQWYEYESGWIRQTDTETVDCGAAPFELQTCFEDDLVPDELCMYNEHKFNGSIEWEANPILCQTNQKLFSYVHTVNDTEITYYLHYQTVKRYTDSNTTFPEWIITADRISTDSYAVCEEYNLLDCVNGSWVVKDNGEDLMQYITPQIMYINNGSCTKEADENEDDQGDNDALIGGIVAGLFIIIIIIGVASFCYCKKKKGSVTITNNEFEDVQMNHASNNNTTYVQNDDYDEPAIEVDVEVPHGYTVTSTSD